MKSKLSATMSAAACLGITAGMAANALANPAVNPDERWPRWYVGLQGGISFLQDTDVKGPVTGKTSYDTGWNGAASLGYRPYFGVWGLDSLRFEMEEGYHYSRMHHATFGGTPTAISSNTHTWSTMGNVYYDLRNDSKFTPYIGAGAGWANVDIPKTAAFGNSDTSDSRWAYQFMAGIAYAPTSIPLTEWTLGYRYFVVPATEFNTSTTPLKVDNYKFNDVELGARFEF